MKNKKSRSINIITMGCSKNLVDSEYILARFASAGWKVEFDATSSGQDLVIINTCGFIGDARQESIDMILEYAGAKADGRIGKLCIIGCLSQRYKDELRKEIPEADLMLGVSALDELTALFELDGPRCSEDERLISTPSHYAFLKISEGCDRTCSFCSIPEIRGKYISRPVESLLSEAQSLANKGVKELILVAQNLTWYGIDLYKRQMLPDLLRSLQLTKGVEWIRLHYAFPAGFPYELLDIMNDSKVICRYLDIPLQHISDNILKKMRRGISKEKTIELINKIREKVPGIALRTTLLTGHPGETEKDFDELKQFIAVAKFDRLGVFPYSHEENTYSWNNYKDDISEKEKNRRVSELMGIQQEISSSLNNARVGQVLKVLVDREDSENYYARTEFDSPEVDNEVIINKKSKLVPGNFYMARVTGSNEFDLLAEIDV